jgi:Ca-activated chloride channel family protein
VFSFQWPWFILLLAVPALFYWWDRRQHALESEEGLSEAATLLHPAPGQLQRAFGFSAPPLPGGRLLSASLLALIWTALTVALMQPQWLESRTEVVTRGYDLMLAVDTSRSMEALDFTVEGQRVNRLAVVKGVVGRFVQQRHGDRIGLILFGDEAFLQAPLTLDGTAVGMLLDDAVPRMAGNGTAIGDAIGLAAKKLRERPEGSRVMILLTDGENTSGSLPPLEAARLAAHYQVRIYTIGVGSKGSVPFPENGRIEMRDDFQIDENLLTEVAKITGGAYFRATDTQALEEIYRRIDALEKTEAETHSLMIPRPLFRWPLGAALVGMAMLALVSLWGRHGRSVRHGA